MIQSHILIIEDDAKVSEFVNSSLEYHGYTTDAAFDGQAGIMLFRANNPDLIILDLGLPDMDGVDVVKAIRETSETPIIILSARTDAIDKVSALDAGADDYLTKPFSVDELLARIRVGLRHRVQTPNVPKLTNGSITLDLDATTISVNHQELHVTPTEYKLMVLFMNNLDRVLTYQTILKDVWGSYSDNIPALRVFVTTLRKKIEKHDAKYRYIQTHVGVGYRMIKIEDEPK